MVEQRTVADKIGNDVLDRLDAQNGENPIQQIKRRIDENDTKRGFSISRIPTEAHEDFKTLAKNMFADDYGMTIAGLVHSFKTDDRHTQQLNDAVERIEARLDRIEEKLDEEEDDSGEVNTLQ